MITLYRGISVPTTNVSEVIQRINSHGLTETESRVSTISTVSEELAKELFKQDILMLEETRNNSLAQNHQYTYASADKRVGEFYAVRDLNSSKTPLLITFQAHLDDLLIDGNDLLYTLFQMPIQNDEQTTKREEILKKMYGNNVLPYFHRAVKCKDVDQRIAFADLAQQDKKVISHHVKNEIIVSGRNKVPIVSIFYVKVPVLFTNIISVNETSTPLISYQHSILEFI